MIDSDPGELRLGGLYFLAFRADSHGFKLASSAGPGPPAPARFQLESSALANGKCPAVAVEPDSRSPG